MMDSHLLKYPGISDLAESVTKAKYAFYLGWLDVKQRYRRSKVGPFWITISMAVTIFMIGVVFGKILNTSYQKYLPHLSLGIVVWNYVLSTITDACAAFIGFRGVILERPLPLFFHIIRVLSKNSIIFFHNLLIIPVVLIVCEVELHFGALMVVLGMLLIVFNLAWISLFVAIVCTRFRDLVQLVVSGLQIVFYVTPVIWIPEQVQESNLKYFLMANPFYYLIEIFRSPLLGEGADFQVFWGAVFFAFSGWIFVCMFFNSFKNRVPYWV